MGTSGSVAELKRPMIEAGVNPRRCQFGSCSCSWLLLSLSSHSTIRMAEQVARTAKESFDASQLLDSSERHKALIALKDALTTSKEAILAANARDIEVSYCCCSDEVQRS